MIGGAVLSGRDLYTAGFQGALKLSNEMPGLELHLTVLRLDLVKQHSELREVASECKDTRAQLNDALAKLKGRLDIDMTRLEAHVETLRFDVEKSKEMVFQDELTQFRGLVHEFRDSFQSRISKLETTLNGAVRDGMFGDERMTKLEADMNKLMALQIDNSCEVINSLQRFANS